MVSVSEITKSVIFWFHGTRKVKFAFSYNKASFKPSLLGGSNENEYEKSCNHGDFGVRDPIECLFKLYLPNLLESASARTVQGVQILIVGS